jgi:predicted nucleic acid-binding Zn ribbon protein
MSASKMELPCPTCGKMAQRLVSGGAGLVFKGSGFYITDYGKDGKKDQRQDPKSTSEKSEGSSTESKTAGSSDSSSSKSDKLADPSKKESTPAPPPSGSSGGE